MTYAAIDLGASSGRVMAARVTPSGLTLTEVRRFPNEPVAVGGVLHWDVLFLYREILAGLRSVVREYGPITSIGIDSWAVDYGLLDGDGSLLGNPVHYRDSRTAGVASAVFDVVPEEELYARTGLQHLPFNTVFQLAAARGSAQLGAAATLLMVPDLIAYWLTGEVSAEETNASTTQLFDARTRDWAWDLIDRLDLPRSLFPPVVAPGTTIGTTLPALGLGEVPVVAVGTHDTASAVVGVPAASPSFAYVSCGTWSLVGVELAAPVLTPESRAANFTNEAGVDGTVRYLRNVMGLWLLQESLREWDLPLAPLLEQAAALPKGPVIDTSNERLLPPGDMPSRLAALCTGSGQPVPATPVEYTRLILDSLAADYARAVSDAVRLSGAPVEVLHIVGGGSQNELLCQLAADACGLPVLAGPVEASALGNAVVQARAAGALSGDLAALRTVIAASIDLRRYDPTGA